MASTIVFALQSAVDTKMPLNTFVYASPLYELTEFDVSVANPFDCDCDFSLTVLNATPDQLDADLNLQRAHSE